jgi:Tol biopolymer transport system component/serine/threonine protein kinase
VPLAAGQRLGPYEILGPLGAGGMGEVYRARDPRLERDVAIKVLPEHFVDDADSLARFQAEAKAIAALSHPNIVAIFDTGQHGDQLYVVTELLEGETLRSRLRQGPFGARKAAEHAARVAQGLAAAHDKGIVHRDIKPENLFLLNDGRVKILDFGLARQDPILEGSGDLSSSPTAARPTNPGAMIGTVGYLSPEQARGDPADHRSDIFSLGAVLYEMLTGHRAFKGTSPAELLSSVLRDEPPAPSESEHRIPRALDLIVHHCLEKNPDERFQSARDLAFHLDSLGSTSASQRVGELPSPETRRWQRLLPAGLAALVLLGAGFEIGRRVGVSSRGGGRAAPLSFQQVTDQPGEERQARLGPGGTNFVFVSDASGNPDIYLQRVGGRNPVNLTPDSPEADTAPALSPDGDRIAFCSERDGPKSIYVMGSTGESVKRLTDFGHDPAWSPDGKQIVFSDRDGQDPWSRITPAHLWIVPSSGGDVRQLTREGDAVQPSWSPGGRRIAYWGLKGGSGQRDIWTIPADATGEPTPVTVTSDATMDWDPVWSPDGRSLYFASERGGSMNLWRVGIEETSGRPRGEPEPVTTPSRTSGSISFSRDGRLLMFVSSDRRSSIQRLGIDPATGHVTEPPRPAFQGSRVIYTQDISPDGEWIAFTPLGGREDLFVVKSDGTGYRQITDDAARDRGPKWSPDGKRIAFYSDRSGRYETWTIRPDGSGLEQLTKATGPGRTEVTWSPDGKRIATNDGAHTWIEDLTQPRAQRQAEALPVLEGGQALQPRSWSPDGRLLAGSLTFYLSPNSVTLLYSFATRTYTALPEGRGLPAWLSDSRRLLVARYDRIVLLDTRTGRATPVLDAAAQGISVSRDNRWVSYIETRAQSDVWLATLEP